MESESQIESEDEHEEEHKTKGVVLQNEIMNPGEVSVLLPVQYCDNLLVSEKPKKHILSKKVIKGTYGVDITKNYWALQTALPGAVIRTACLKTYTFNTEIMFEYDTDVLLRILNNEKKYLVTDRAEYYYFDLLDAAWGYGTAEIPAPQAQLMKMIVEGIMGGNLPWGLVFVGVFLAICLEILRIPVMPFAIGLYLPIYLNATIMIGGIVRGLLDRRKGVDEKTKTAQATDGTLYCAGMIAGEGLVGILLAIFAVVGISLDMSGVVNLGNIGGVVLMIIMILSLLKFSIWRKKKA